MSETLSPRSLGEALQRLADTPDCIPIAGCTDWMVKDALARADAPPLLDLLRVEELCGVEKEDAGLRIGATTSFSALRGHAEVRARYPILAEVASLIGGRQIQNRATLGGNIVNASPAGDSLPVLLALDAELELASIHGSRRLPYAEFHTGYRETARGADELLVAIHLPAPPPYQRFRKVGTRRAQAISKVVVALCADTADGRWSKLRVAAGSVAPTPLRLKVTETVVEGMPLGMEAAEAAAEAARGEVEPIDDVRSSAHYRRWVLGRVIRRLFSGCLDAPPGTV
jgi:CO/xanthine dehydrogenase FAD-binding subunit